MSLSKMISSSLRAFSASSELIKSSSYCSVNPSKRIAKKRLRKIQFPMNIHMIKYNEEINLFI